MQTTIHRRLRMKRFLFVLFSVIAVSAMAFSSVAAGNVFGGATSTEDGYRTWDSDMINVEEVDETGAGVYVAVLDTGLVPNWQDYFPKARVATDLGTGFDQPVSFSRGKDPCQLDVAVGQLHQTTWVGSSGSTHGTHVASTILGYFYRSNTDAAQGFALPPIMVRGIAPNVTIIPVKVLADYQVPALPKCDDPGPLPAQHIVFGTDEMVAAGIDYVTGLANAGYKPIVINMSLGDTVPAQVMEDAIDNAIAAGVIVVASAGNEGEAGMGWPGAYPQVISAGASGWTEEWLKPGTEPALPNRYRMWWLQDGGDFAPPLFPATGEVTDPTLVDDVYVTDFSSRELAGQDLDVLAPGSWVRGPFGGDPGYNHLPWWSKGIGDLVGGNSGNFYYVGGTSMAAPHVTSAAALLLEKDPGLTQSEVEDILTSTALTLPDNGSQTILDNTAVATITWDTDCDGTPCDPVGSGLLQVDAALAAVP
jgi:subtilisin family serine protease